MATAAFALLALSAMQGALAAPLATCPGQFTKISAETWLQRANPGWNLGNTLDALPTEGSWNNPPVQPSTFNQIQAAGFKGMRIPVTWNDHFASGSPNWTVDSTWLQRVNDVVDLSLSRGFYTIVNVHHDSWNWADVTAAGANYTEIEERFYSLWVQIGTKLGCKSSMLAFEPINEPPGNTQADADEINKLNSLFLKAISAAGGFNKDRVVTLSGPGQDGAKTSQFFKRPTDITNPWAIQVCNAPCREQNKFTDALSSGITILLTTSSSQPGARLSGAPMLTSKLLRTISQQFAATSVMSRLSSVNGPQPVQPQRQLRGGDTPTSSSEPLRSMA